MDGDRIKKLINEFDENKNLKKMDQKIIILGIESIGTKVDKYYIDIDLEKSVYILLCKDCSTLYIELEKMVSLVQDH